MRDSSTKTAFSSVRLGILLAYFFNGLALSSWMVRLPGIREGLDLSVSEVSLFLSAGAIGTLLTVTFAGAAVMRFGPLRTYQVATIAFVLAYLLLGLSMQVGGLPLLLLANVLHGAAFALTNVPQSILAAANERAVGRTILPQFHAGYSIGSAVGAAAGGAAAALGLAVLPQLFGLAVVAVVIRQIVARLARPLALEVQQNHVAAAQALPIAKGASLRVWGESQTLLLGLIVFAAALSEGAANNWAALSVVDAFSAPESEGAIALTAFLVAQTAVRLVGGPAIDRLGRLTMLRLSGAVSIVGLGVFALAPSLPLAVCGMALWGPDPP
ncbi:MFS transporter [Agreia bicolorata]|uniref:MFS transporter n=1 Tax=Agreia bicolorata TaxID=110935 RepID=UPI00069762CD|nr:MFS transporter [Agreia bicolorata]